MPEGPWQSFVRRAPLALVGVGIAGIVLAFDGEYRLRPGSCPDDPVRLADAIWKSVALVVFQSTPEACDPGPVVAGRLMAPALSGGALLLVLNSWLMDLFGKLRLRAWSGHTVVVGSGTTAQVFAHSLPGAVAFAGPGANDIFRSWLPTIRLQSSVPQIVEWLGTRRFGLRGASRILIATGSDAQNLSVLQALQSLPWPSPRRTRPVPPVQALLETSSALLYRELDERDDLLVRPGAGAMDVMPFHPDILAARRFLEDHPLVDLALLRAQSHLRLLMVGLSPFAIACLEGAARLNPGSRLGTPEVDIFVVDTAAAARQIRSVQPAFFVTDFNDPSTEAAAPLRIRLHEVDDVTRIPTTDQLLALGESRAAVTAMIVSDDDDVRAGAMSLALRDRCQRAGACRGPLFVRLNSESAIRQGLVAKSDDPDPAGRIVAVGAVSDVHDWAWLFGPREEAARRLHAEHATRTGREPWALLAQTLRNANRRAVDQLPIKLMVAGLAVTGRPLRAPALSALGIDLTTTTQVDPTVEALAAVEHASWDVDRRLAGWRQGAHRDDIRRVHPMVGLSFEGLGDESVKDLDRSQVRASLQMLEEQHGDATVRRELRIGVIGRLTLSPADTRRATEFAAAAIRQVAADPDAFISVMSPLAPGSDLVMTRVIMATLVGMGRRHTSRLVHVRSVPTGAVVTRFVTNHPEQSADTLRREIDALLSEYPSIVADLEVPAIDADRWHTDLTLQEQGFRRANAYLVSRCHHLIAFGTGEDSQAAAAPGGTREAVEWAQQGIPDAFALPMAILHAPPPLVHSPGPLESPE